MTRAPRPLCRVGLCGDLNEPGAEASLGRPVCAVVLFMLAVVAFEAQARVTCTYPGIKGHIIIATSAGVFLNVAIALLVVRYRAAAAQPPLTLPRGRYQADPDLLPTLRDPPFWDAAGCLPHRGLPWLGGAHGGTPRLRWGQCRDAPGPWCDSA